ncbi:gamma-glutamyl-gamma-aminobutyrate hydrolase family protein [Catenisphaera adipataccumulans]|uniref:Putative glutamine amidotransferase n=1 Tax=Catenisphaera adipataccumulans TaxID=700500 RepID=A0A7W8CWE0_9FIRM|nr:gamma-glutamyl-gamma-aminobutyrate hydrolase family protein [Catenisphaera adipataccumulans]MBB5182566.1 putative glutamine amidotransferase [Catenisphaera adipataccumulans]
MKPIIGVLSLYDQERESIWMLPGYMAGITTAGGIALQVPLTITPADWQQIAGMFDGFLFTGGQDIDPFLYGQHKEGSGELCGQRDQTETMIYRYAAALDLPILGICRGIQWINVMEGGTLYQDLPKERPSAIDHHMHPPYDRTAHQVTVVPNSPLDRLWHAQKKGVNSYHHQGVYELADSLRAMAYAEDGLIEAVYHPEHSFLWGVQWHPEFSFQSDPDQLSIFRIFVQACRQRKRR